MTRLLIPIKKNDSFVGNIDLDLAELHLEPRFGRTPFYFLADLDSQEWELIQNTNHHFGGVDTPVSIASKHKVDLIFASHIGYGPYIGLKNKKIKILHVPNNESVNSIIDNFKLDLYNEITPPEKGMCCSGNNH